MKQLWHASTFFGATVVASVLVYGAIQPPPCKEVPPQVPQEGAHGFRTWQSSILLSFEHAGERFCIPPDFESLGALENSRGSALFREGTTGVFIRSSAFASSSLTFTHSPYHVVMRYDATLSSERVREYEEMVRYAFEHVGELFPATKAENHTVLITAELGFIPEENGSIYPDPGPAVSYLILPPENPRSEELFMHAIMHLHNRHRPDLTHYQTEQDGSSAIDFQELEAAWSETALGSSNERRAARVDYLFNIHRAVFEDDFSRIIAPPFNDTVAFETISGKLKTSDASSFADTQYAHYVLAPLLMIATDALLTTHTDTDVATILREVHTGERGSFFDTLSELLPVGEMERIQQWMEGTEAIPYELIETGLAHYRRS